MKPPIAFTALMPIVLALVSAPLSADEPAGEPENAFQAQAVPLLQMYCTSCHNDEQQEAELSLASYQQASNVQQDYVIWQKVAQMLAERQMPPEGEMQPTEEERQQLIAIVEGELAKFDCTNVESRPGRVTLRRLNRAEYNNTLRDLLGIEFNAAADFPNDEVGNGFDNMGDVLSMPPLLLEKYLAAAEQAAEIAFNDDAARQRLLPHQPNEDEDRREAARRNLHDFATRAFRRPATDREIDRLNDLMRSIIDNGGSEIQGYQAAVQAVLCSPHFLFKVELDPEPDDDDGIRELNDYEIATRLSYFLWSSMPDEELFQLARDGKLRDHAVVKQQVQRMLRDPKARALTANFAGQWLQLRDVANMTPDPQRFPSFDAELRAAMQRETELFFETMISEDRSVLDFLGADFTFVNERLAKHYGIAGVAGDEFRRVSLPDQRRGVLTQASILLITSNPTRTSPVKRGKWILDNILGEPPPPPPPGVEELEETELLGSLRERMAQHMSNESCAVCHRQMDPLGFGLENFDAIGAWRDNDGQFPIDPAGVLPGGLEFRGPKELIEVLQNDKRDEFCKCLAEKMLTYALGRGLVREDACAVEDILKQLAEEDYRFSALVAAIVTSDPFLMREAKEEE